MRLAAGTTCETDTLKCLIHQGVDTVSRQLVTGWRIFCQCVSCLVAETLGIMCQWRGLQDISVK